MGGASSTLPQFVFEMGRGGIRPSPSPYFASRLIPIANQLIPIANHLIPFATQPIPFANQLIAFANQLIPFGNQLIPFGKRNGFSVKNPLFLGVLG